MNISVKVLKLLTSCEKKKFLRRFLSFANLYIRLIAFMSKNIINQFWISYFLNVFFSWKSLCAFKRNKLSWLLTKSKMLHKLQYIQSFLERSLNILCHIKVNKQWITSKNHMDIFSEKMFLLGKMLNCRNVGRSKSLTFALNKCVWHEGKYCSRVPYNVCYKANKRKRKRER